MGENFLEVLQYSVSIFLLRIQFFESPNPWHPVLSCRRSGGRRQNC